jgi:hypothetical protein
MGVLPFRPERPDPHVRQSERADNENPHRFGSILNFRDGSNPMPLLRQDSEFSAIAKNVRACEGAKAGADRSIRMIPSALIQPAKRVERSIRRRSFDRLTLANTHAHEGTSLEPLRPTRPLGMACLIAEHGPDLPIPAPPRIVAADFCPATTVPRCRSSGCMTCAGRIPEPVQGGTLAGECPFPRPAHKSNVRKADYRLIRIGPNSILRSRTSRPTGDGEFR